MKQPFDFILLAGPKAEEYRDQIDKNIYFDQTERPYWWAGMEFYCYENPDDVRLFLDLDVVVVGSLDKLFEYESPFICSRDWASHNAPCGHENDANPGVTLLRGNAGQWVWDEYVKAGTPVWNPHDKTVDHSPCHMAAQGIINERRGWAVELFPQEVCASYKFTAMRHGLPDGCVTVHFHGQPKPHDCGDLWIRDNWK